MAAPELPQIFLSHAGEQKGFVWHLYRELLHVHHNPFFDQDAGVDSLPKGISFVTRILQASRACKLGVVVLSHDYIESLWPMLELQQFFFHNPHSPYILPLFYKLKPADLSREENLTRWRTAWQESEASWKAKVQQMCTEDSDTSSSMPDSQSMLDISLWPEALRRLRSQSGQMLPDNKDEHPYIQDIVSNICQILPPPQSFFRASYFKGAEHIQEIIHGLFEQQQTRYHEIDDSVGGSMPICVGLHGVGGSGKTTVCNYMLSFYAKEYPGSCCFLQLPSNENQRELLVASMKHILSERGGLQKERLEKINMVEQALPHVHELLRRYRVFLVVDNIWDWALSDVHQILATDYMQGSRLLVTARSRGLLQKLSDARGGRPAIHIEHVPSITHAEAIEALKAYSLSSWQGFGTNAEGLFADIARSCFVEEQCHPLLLKVVGAKLRHLGGSSHINEGLQNLRSCLQSLKLHGDENIEKGIVSVLRTSYDALNSRLQEILLMLGTCVPNYDMQTETHSVCKWLSKAYDSGSQSIESIRAQMLELEYHGLIETHKGDVVFIHDLQMVMINNIVRENKDSPQCFFFEGDMTTLSKSKLRSLKFICGDGKVTMGGLSISRQLWKEIRDVFPLNRQRATGPNILDVEVLRVRGFIQLPVLNVGMMRFLRHLELKCIRNVVWVTGWDGAPNLVSVDIFGCKFLRWIGSMTCLSSLKELRFSNLDEWTNTGMLRGTLSGCTALQECRLRSNCHICKFPRLSLINLSRCKRLRSMEGSECGLTALEELDLHGCSSLKSIPDLKQLVKLRSLRLNWCYALEEVKVGEATLTSLETLGLQYSHTHISITGSGSALPISAFSNLRTFYACGDLKRGFTRGRKVNVGTISLPTSLETLSLWGFAEAREMPDVSGLVNLKILVIGEWSSLTSVTGLGALTKLKTFQIVHCPALQEVEPCSSSDLEGVLIRDCAKLERLPAMSSRRSFTLRGCPMVKEEMLPPQVLPEVESEDEGISVYWRQD